MFCRKEAGGATLGLTRQIRSKREIWFLIYLISGDSKYRCISNFGIFFLLFVLIDQSIGGQLQSGG